MSLYGVSTKDGPIYWKERHRILKQRCVDYLGGECKACGYNKCLAALDFHHREPKEKEFSIAELLTRKWETIKRELDKCDLLCANCHRELHDKLKAVASIWKNE